MLVRRLHVLVHALDRSRSTSISYRHTCTLQWWLPFLVAKTFTSSYLKCSFLWGHLYVTIIHAVITFWHANERFHVCYVESFNALYVCRYASCLPSHYFTVFISFEVCIQGIMKHIVNIFFENISYHLRANILSCWIHYIRRNSEVNWWHVKYSK